MKTITVNEYIDSFPKEVRTKLKEMRSIIKKASPKAEEMISYGLAGFKLDGKYLAYYGGFKNHVGFYPFPTGVKEFEKLSSNYKTTKGGIQFPLDKPIPVSLVKKVIAYRLKELSELKTQKKKK